MSLHSYLRQRYGSSTQRRVREFEKRLHQKAKCSNSHIFSMRCRDEGVIPASLRIKPMVRTREGYAIAERASRAFLRARVHQTFRRKQTLVQQIAKLQASFEHLWPDIRWSIYALPSIVRVVTVVQSQSVVRDMYSPAIKRGSIISPASELPPVETVVW